VNLEVYDIKTAVNTATFYYIERDLALENELNKNRDILERGQWFRYYKIESGV
jgi:hypothetical protein